MAAFVTSLIDFRAVNIPNLFTTIRILLVPIFFMCIYYEMRGYPSMDIWTKVTLLIIIISDFVDGYLARLLNETTVLGSLLDPFADKLFVLTSYILLAVFQKVPVWLSIIVVSKDILVVAGWVVLMLIYQKVSVKPSMLGKLATAFQFFTVCGIIFLPESGFIIWLYGITGILTVAAVIHYGLSLSIQEQTETSLPY